MFIKITALLSLIIQSFIGFTQGYTGDNWAKVKATGSGTLTVVYVEQYGLIYKDKDGKMKGICVDILSDLAAYAKDKYGKTIKVHYAGEEPVFSNFLKTVKTTPNILGVTNTTITEERKKIFKFSPPYMLNRLVMLTSNKAPSITSLKELSSKFTGFSAQVIGGSTHVQYIQKMKMEYMPTLSVTYETNGPAIIKNLSANPKLFTVIDFTEFIDAVHKKLPIKLQQVDVGIVEELGFIMSTQSDWDSLLKEFLTIEYRNSTRYKRIISDNLGATFLSLVK